MDQHVLELIRNKETDTALYTLADMSPGRVWNYELPTLTTKGRFTARQPWNTCGEFAEAFFNKFPIFSKVDMSNIAVMGGAPFDFLHKRESQVSDVDLFLVGDLPGEASESVETKVLRRAEKFIDDVYAYLEGYVEKCNEASERMKAKPNRAQAKIALSSLLEQLSASRNGPVITFNIPTVSCAVQLVLSHHADVQALLRRVDLDCTAMAFVNGKTLYFNTISKFCFENACTIVGQQCSTCFESRIAKYFSEKEIDIILARLDLSKVPSRNLKYKVDEVLDLSRMAVIFEEVQPPGKIITRRIVPNAALGVETTAGDGNVRRLVPATGSTNGPSYSRSGASKSVKNAGTIIHENLIHLLHGFTGKFQFYSEGKFLKDVLLPIPKFTTRSITNTFATVSGQLEGFGEGEVNTLLLEKYFVVKPTSEILTDILVGPLKKGEALRREGPADASVGPTSALDTRHKDFCKAYFADLIAQQIAQAGEKLTALEEEFKANPAKFKVVSDMTFENFSAEDWYGPQYVKAL